MEADFVVLDLCETDFRNANDREGCPPLRPRPSSPFPCFVPRTFFTKALAFIGQPLTAAGYSHTLVISIYRG